MLLVARCVALLAGGPDLTDPHHARIGLIAMDEPPLTTGRLCRQRGDTQKTLSQLLEALKRELAERYRDDREAYTEAKGEFVRACEEPQEREPQDERRADRTRGIALGHQGADLVSSRFQAREYRGDVRRDTQPGLVAA
jgi:hypothetical protein